MKMHKRVARRRGISLAEVVIALAIIMIVSAATATFLVRAVNAEAKTANTLEHNERMENVLECYQWANGNETVFYAAIDKLGYPGSVTVDFPTCTTDGLIACACDECGGSIVYLAPIGHVWSTVTYNFAEDGKTCTAERTCKREGTYTETVEANITFERGEAFCTKMGTTTYTATFGEDVTWAETQTKDVQDIAVLDHSYTGDAKSDGNGKDATHSFKCVHGCNEYGAAVNHTWNNGEQTTAPTCTVEGVMTYTCTVSGCGAIYTETIDIDAAGHKDEDHNHACDNGCAVYQGTHADGDYADHKCDYCQGDVCVDSNEDGNCDECESPMAD